MNIIIPIGGIGARFQTDGYTRPKPLINVLGRAMISYVIENLHINKDDVIHIIYNGDLDKFAFGEFIKHLYPKIKLMRIDNRTRGAAETVVMCLRQFSDAELARKTITIDCDTFYVYDVVNKYRDQTDNAVFCFVDTLKDPIYSYVNFTNSPIIIEIKEKEKISNYANTGCYCFSSGEILKQYCERAICMYEEGEHDQKELYMSGIIGNMINDNHVFRANIISDDDFHCLGTPFQVKVFCKEYGKKFTKRLRFCFDLDNTLVTFPDVEGDYATVRPIINVIRVCRYLKSLGHTIVIYTARRMKTHNGNVNACIADIGKLTIDTLAKFDIPYDELCFGKPYAHFYIDDLAIDSRFDLEREIGIYKTDVEERSFNNICVKSDNIITKSGQTDKIKGEIYWYQNIPHSIKHLFPHMYTHSKLGDSYDMEKICGVNMSYLYVTESMSTKMLDNFLETIEQIHNSMHHDAILPKDDIALGETNLNIYANYCDKIKSRYEKYNYSIFPHSGEVYEQLMSYFTEYFEKDYGQITVVHGDPVFSNCILNEYGQFKFFDMRGLLGNVTTIFGDKWYDYGKIYQSLIGYDEILLDKTLSIDYRASMIATFKNFIEKKFGEDVMTKIRMITNSLLFTLIPLHDNEKCKKYYGLIDFCEKSL